MNKFTLLSTSHLTTKIILVVIMTFLSLESHATHLIGGNMGYEYLGPDPNIAGNIRYRITLDAYQDCNSTNWWDQPGGVFPEASANIGIYESEHTPANAVPNVYTFNLQLTDSNEVDPNLPQICDPFNLLSNVCVYLTHYERIVSLAPSAVGYWVVYDRCCRPGGIRNLSNSGTQSFVYSTWIPAMNGALITNTSAQFTDTLLSYICRTDTAYISNSATDPDGDSLVYTLVTPFIGLTQNGTAGNNQPVLPYNTFPMNPYTIPPAGVTYAPGYSLTNLLGTSSFSSVDPATGLTRFLTSTVGTYVAAVEITEYRNGVIVGSTRRNMQLIADNCPNNNMPNQDVSNLDPDAVTPLNYEVDAGDTICFSLEYNDLDGDPLEFVATSDIFNSAITNPAATVTSPVTGNGRVTGTICWQPSCSQGRQAPYVIDVVVTDSACPPLPLPQLLYIKVKPFEGPKAIYGDTVICFGPIPTVVTTDTLANVNYSWTVTGGTIVSGNGTPNLAINWTPGQTSGTISVTSTNQFGCVDGPITKNVILSDIVADAGSDQIMCEGLPVTIGGSPTSANANNTILWSPAAGLDDPTKANPIANPTVTTTYVVSLTNARGCVGTDTVIVTVNNLIPSGVLNDYFLCPGDTLNVTATGASFTWTPNVFISSTTVANPSIYPPSNQTYMLNFFDINGCEGNDTTIITVNQTVPTDAGPDAQICDGDSFSLGGNPTGPFGTTYNWQPTTNMNNNALANPSVLPSLGSNTYIVVTSNDTCTGRDTVTVIVAPSPTLSVSNNTYVCAGDTTQIQANGTGTFVWNNGNTLSDSTIASPNAFPTVPTTYTVVLTDANSCESTDSVFVDIQSLPVASAGDTIDACKIAPTRIGGTPTGPNNSQYVWTPSTGLNDPTIANPLATLINDQMYIVQVTDSLGCKSSDTVFVEVFRLSGLKDTIVCKNEKLELITNRKHGVGPFTYLWSNGKLLSDSTIASPFITVGSQGLFSVTVTDANNCSDTVSFNINLLAATQSSFTYEVLPTCEGVGVQVTDNSIGAVSYEWLIDGKTVSTDENPLLVFEYNKDAVVSLITTSSDGCFDTTEVSVTGPKFDDIVDITVSNVFTPNGDGENDYFEIQSNGDLSSCVELTIFNRSGQVVHESTGGIHTWDGRSSTGVKFPDGVYFYIFNINGTEFHGNVTLMR